MKAWKFYNNVPITSFYLELRLTKYAEGRTSIVYDLDIRNILKLLHDNQLPRLQDPMGFSGYVWPCKTEARRRNALSKLATGYGRAVNACTCRIARPDLAFEWWQKFFSYEFPAR
jgi:hypothetical protein